MRTSAVLILSAFLAVCAALPAGAPARAATDDSNATNPPPQSERQCERRRETPTS